MAAGRRRPGARWWLVLVLVALAVAACSPNDEEDGLTVFAAASLHDVVEELETAWVEGHPDAPLTMATEASNVLAAQIAEGAPADVFMSADTVRPQELVDAGLTAADPVLFARNRLTLVVPLANDRIEAPADLAEPDVRIVAINPGAPITRYAEEALAQLALTMSDPEAFTEAVAANIVSREDNVRAALAKVELGEGDAVIVYRTDALGSERTRDIPLPDIDVTAEYAAVVISDHALALDFVEWLGGPEATAVITANGFEVDRP